MAGWLAGPRRLLSPSTPSVLCVVAFLWSSSFAFLSFFLPNIFFVELLPTCNPELNVRFDLPYSTFLLLFCFPLLGLISFCLVDLASRYLVRYTNCLFRGHGTAIAWLGMTWMPFRLSATACRREEAGPYSCIDE